MKTSPNNLATTRFSAAKLSAGNREALFSKTSLQTQTDKGTDVISEALTAEKWAFFQSLTFANPPGPVGWTGLTASPAGQDAHGCVQSIFDHL